MAVQNSNPWSLTVSGLKWLPAMAIAQAASIGAGLLAGCFTWEIVKGLFTSSPKCPLSSSQDLKEAGGMLLMMSGQPALEEALIRNVFQGIILTSLPKVLMGRIAPSFMPLVDSRIVMAARTLVSAGVFSYLHTLLLPDKLNEMEEKLRNFQVANTFGIGLASAALQERTGTTWPSLGLHVGWNLLYFSYRTFPSCFNQKSEKMPEDNTGISSFEKQKSRKAFVYPVARKQIRKSSLL